MKKFLTLSISIFLILQINAQNWTFKQKIVASDRAKNDRFGFVSVSGDYAIVGASYDDYSISGGKLMHDAGAAYIFEKNSNGVWNQVQKLVASDGKAGHLFGASVSISGNYAIVGSPNDDKDTVGANCFSNAGSAYIFERDSFGSWNQVQKIIASERDTDNWFGYFVSIDSNCALVSAIGNCYDENGLNNLINTGAVFIFERKLNAYWKQKQKIVASDRSIYDLFGLSTRINDSFAIIGVPHDDENYLGIQTLTDAGSAYIFKKDSSGYWRQVQKITPKDRTIYDKFGTSVSIYDDYAIIGAPYESKDVTMMDAGAAYIYKKDSLGVWKHEQKIFPINRENDTHFGQSLSMKANYAIVGTFDDYSDVNGLNHIYRTGSAYIFERNGNGVWGLIEINWLLK